MYKVEVVCMIKYEKVLLGPTRYNTLVFANIECKDYFAVSFDEVEPIAVDDDYLRERVEDLLDNTFTDEQILELLREYDCKPSELVDEILKHWYLEDIIDISLYPESFDGIVEGKTIFFESLACGQHDTREYLLPIDKKFSDWLFSMWDKYHLKDEYPKEHIVCVIEDYVYRLGDREKWIENWLRNLYSLSLRQEV